jgi:hypothetical protein
MEISKGSRRHKLAGWLKVTAKLIAAYVKLSEDEKEIAEDFLAFQVYGEEGMHPYRLFVEDSGELRVEPSTDECPLFSWAKPWAEWAQEIRESVLAGLEPREAVRAMLGALIRQRDKKHLTGLELREAAKTALAWTRGDAKHLKCLRRSLRFASQSEHYVWIEKTLDEMRAKGRG